MGFSLERVMGLEPTISAWKANVLPLHYTRKYLPYIKLFGAGDGARTRHLRLGKAALYRMSYSRIYDGAGEETRTHTPNGTGT